VAKGALPQRVTDQIIGILTATAIVNNFDEAVCAAGPRIRRASRGNPPALMISPQSPATVNLRAHTLLPRRSISTSAMIATTAPERCVDGERDGAGEGRPDHPRPCSIPGTSISV
jgi:hypothetical protein